MKQFSDFSLQDLENNVKELFECPEIDPSLQSALTSIDVEMALSRSLMHAFQLLDRGTD